MQLIKKTQVIMIFTHNLGQSQSKEKSGEFLEWLNKDQSSRKVPNSIFSQSQQRKSPNMRQTSLVDSSNFYATQKFQISQYKNCLKNQLNQKIQTQQQFFPKQYLNQLNEKKKNQESNQKSPTQKSFIQDKKISIDKQKENYYRYNKKNNYNYQPPVSTSFNNINLDYQPTQTALRPQTSLGGTRPAFLLRKDSSQKLPNLVTENGKLPDKKISFTRKDTFNSIDSIDVNNSLSQFKNVGMIEHTKNRYKLQKNLQDMNRFKNTEKMIKSIYLNKRPKIKGHLLKLNDCDSVQYDNDDEEIRIVLNHKSGNTSENNKSIQCFQSNLDSQFLGLFNHQQ